MQSLMTSAGRAVSAARRAVPTLPPPHGGGPLPPHHWGGTLKSSPTPWGRWPRQRPEADQRPCDRPPPSSRTRGSQAVTPDRVSAHSRPPCRCRPCGSTSETRRRLSDCCMRKYAAPGFSPQTRGIGAKLASKRRFPLDLPTCWRPTGAPQPALGALPSGPFPGRERAQCVAIPGCDTHGALRCPRCGSPRSRCSTAVARRWLATAPQPRPTTPCCGTVFATWHRGLPPTIARLQISVIAVLTARGRLAIRGVGFAVRRRPAPLIDVYMTHPMQVLAGC